MHYPNEEPKPRKKKKKKIQTLILGLSWFMILTSVSEFFHLPNITAILKILNHCINQNPENPRNQSTLIKYMNEGVHRYIHMKLKMKMPLLP